MAALVPALAARRGCQTRPNPPTHHHLPPRPSESAAVPHRVRSMSSPRLVDVDLIRDLLEPLGDSAQWPPPHLGLFALDVNAEPSAPLWRPRRNGEIGRAHV